MTHAQLIHDLRNLVTIEKLRTYRLQSRLEDMQRAWEIDDILRSMESSVSSMEKLVK